MSKTLARRANEIALTLGWGEGGYADGPHHESRIGWIDPFGNVWTAREMVRAFDPDKRAVETQTLEALKLLVARNRARTAPCDDSEACAAIAEAEGRGP